MFSDEHFLGTEQNEYLAETDGYDETDTEGEAGRISPVSPSLCSFLKL